MQTRTFLFLLILLVVFGGIVFLVVTKSGGGRPILSGNDAQPASTSEATSSVNATSSDASVSSASTSQTATDQPLKAGATVPADNAMKTTAPAPTPTSAGKSASIVAGKRLTIQFVNQYGEPFRGVDGWRFYFPKVYDSVGEQVPGQLTQTIDGYFEFSTEIPKGTYTIKWGDFWFNAFYTKGETKNLENTSVEREIQGGEARVVVPNQGNWFVSIPAKQIGISYLNGGGYVHLLLRNAAGTSLTLGISDGQGTVVNAQGKKVGSLGWAGSAGNGDKGAFFVGVDKVEGAVPGVYTIEIKRTGYKPKSVTYTLPDVGSWTDAAIIGKHPGLIDLGTVVLDKE